VPRGLAASREIIMNNHPSSAALPLLLAAALVVTATPAMAKSAGVTSGPSFSLGGDHQNRSHGQGTKTMVTALARLPVAPGTTLQLSASSGERVAGGLDVRSGHAGLAHQAGPVRLDYGLAAYAGAGTLKGGLIHRFDGALNDFSGTTHLLLAAGSSLHEHDFRPDKVSGSFRFAGLKRKQKLRYGLAFELTGGWTAFDRPKGRYGAARIGVGLSFAR
jgi:hypothetical protein